MEDVIGQELPGASLARIEKTRGERRWIALQQIDRLGWQARTDDYDYKGHALCDSPRWIC